MWSSRRSWALGAVGALAGMLLLASAALRWLLPAFLEQQVRAALRERGVEPVALEVHPPGLGGLRVREVRLGAAHELRIGEIALGWSAASLRRGRVEALAIRDVEWRIALREGRLDFGALAPLFEPAPEPAAGATGPLALPLDRASLEALRIRLDAPGGPVEARAALALVFGGEGVESGRFTFEASDAEGALELHGEAALEAGARIRAESSGRLASGAALDVAGIDSGRFALRLAGLAPVAARVLRAAPAPSEGLRVDATLAAEAKGSGVEGGLEASLRVEEERAELKADVRSVRGDGFAIPGATFSAKALDWTRPIPVLDSLVLSAPELRVGDVALGDVQLDLRLEPGAATPRGRIGLRGEAKATDAPAARVDLDASFETDGEVLRISAPECTRIGLAAGVLGAGGWRLAEPLALCVENGAATLRADGAGGFRAEGRLGLAPSGFQLAHRDGRRVAGTTPRLEAEGSRDAGADALRVRSAGGDVHVEAARLAVRGLAAEASLTRNGAGVTQAQLQLALQELRDLAPEPRLTPLSLVGEASLDAERVHFDATLRDATGLLQLGAKGEHALGSGHGHAGLELPVRRFEKDGPQLEAVVPVLAAYLSRVRGGLAANARLAWGPKGLDPVRADLALDALSANTPWLRLRGLAGALRLEDALAATSAPRQHLTARRVDPGLPFEDAALSFTLASGALELHALEAALAGGRLQATGRYDPTAGAGRLDLNLESLDLVRLLEGERVEGLAATGRLGGRIEAALAGGVPQRIEGRLASDAAGGVIRYRPAVPPAALAGAGTGGTLALEALRDFRYERLLLSIEGDLAQAQVRVELRGSNPAVENGRPIEFQLNFTSAFGELLRAWRLEQDLEERIGRPPQATPRS